MDLRFRGISNQPNRCKNVLRIHHYLANEMNATEKYPVILNEATSQFEVILPDDLAYIDYKWYNEMLILLYIFVPVPYRGKNISSVLINYALEYAKSKGVKIKVFCPYIAKYIRLHPEYAELLARNQD